MLRIRRKLKTRVRFFRAVLFRSADLDSGHPSSAAGRLAHVDAQLTSEMGTLRGSAAARALLQLQAPDDPLSPNDDNNEPPTVVGVTVTIPIPVISDLFGSETPHEKRYVRVFSHELIGRRLTSPSSVSLGRSWWFWVIIAIIACFFIVAVWFTVRGWRRYRHVYRPRLTERAPPGALRWTAGGALSQPGAHAPVGMQDAWKMKTLVKVNPRYAVDV